MTEHQQPENPFRFGESDSVLVAYVTDLYKLLRAIDESMPKDAILYLEGRSFAAQVKSFLASRPAAAQRDIARGTVYPVPETFHMSLEGRNLAELRALAEHYAEPEICDHLAVYRDDELLLTAHDAGDGEVYVARSLPGETVRQLQLELADA